MTQTAGTGAVPEVGAPAPDFTLKSTSGEAVTISGWRGKKNVLLAFFPAAFTSVCATEMQNFGQEIDRFENAGTKVYGISVDSVPTLKEFQNKLGVQTEMLSDFRHEISRRYGVHDEDRFQARRSYFLLDRDGTLRWRHLEQPGQLRSNDELLAEIAKLS